MDETTTDSAPAGNGRSAFFDLTAVGPGTLMGEFMRQYWIPAALSSELTVDGDPMRLPLLGEKLIAFRDSSGKVGVMDQRCPHRCASLFLGRNEDDGIRCVYHGWKFSTDGTCVDMPNVPNQAEFRSKIQAKAYPVTEQAGLIWVYMGPRAVPPPLPQLEVTMVPESEIVIEPVLRNCNWLQALEGDIDTSHFGFLHVGHVQPEDLDPGNPLYHTVTNRAPAYHTNDYVERTTDWFGRWRIRHDESDDWGIDRAAQREGRIFTGIADIHLQDQAVTESMGPVTDFDFEHLTVSDQMIATTRRRILEAARALRSEGTVPPGVDTPELFREARSGFFLAADGIDWRDAYQAETVTMERPGEPTPVGS